MQQRRALQSEPMTTMTLRWMALGAAAAALVGCATKPAPVTVPSTREASATPSAPASAPAPAAPRPSPLAAEQRWLSALFEGTPVRISGEGDGLRLDVPLRYAFANDAAEPLPPLKAVLQRMALSMQRQPTTRLAIGAPGPAASERALAMRQQLQGLGVAGYRISATGAALPDGVSLKLALAPAAIGRLEDRKPTAQP